MRNKNRQVATNGKKRNGSVSERKKAFDQILDTPDSTEAYVKEAEKKIKAVEDTWVGAILSRLQADSPDQLSAMNLYYNLNNAFTAERIDQVTSDAILERVYSDLTLRCEQADATSAERNFLRQLLISTCENVWTNFSSANEGLSQADQVAELKKIKTTRVVPVNGLYYRVFAELIAWLETGLTSEREQAEKRSNPDAESKKERADRNLARTTCFLDIIFGELGVRAKTKDLQEVISFLTGYSPNTIKGVLNNPGAKSLESPAAHKHDVEIVARNFRRLGLLELAEKASRDLS